jgi:D-lyxose ketol-isomerase
MTVSSAQQFIQHTVIDPSLVQRINAASDKTEIEEILREIKYEFNYEQFDKAYFNVLTWCQTHEQAQAVKEVKLWWDCLGYYMAKALEQ